MRSHRIFTHLAIFVLGAFVAACSSGSGGDPRLEDGGIQFVDGAVPPPGTCVGDVCTVTDGGVTITGPDGGVTQCFFIQCQGRVTACGDCSDNDDDGLIDNYDPECLGPCDNYEGEELLSGVGGETGEQCKADCYFDFGNGAGNDDCHWSRSCDPLEPKLQCTYNEGLLGRKDCPETQSQLCEDVCTPLTPNGCDCFGCCTFPELAGMGPSGGTGYVYIGSESGCTFDTVTDPASCQACTPAGNCLNTCGRCEICLGKPTIPEDCFPGTGGTGGSGGTAGTGGMAGSGGGERCPAAKQVCGLPGDAPCPGGSFCLTGCCTEIVVQ
jgi:hypothetical protein